MHVARGIVQHTIGGIGCIFILVAMVFLCLVPEAQAIEIAAFLKRRVVISGQLLCF